MSVPEYTAVASKYDLDDDGNAPDEQINSLGSSDYPYEIIAADIVYVSDTITDGTNSASVSEIINHNHDGVYSTVGHTHTLTADSVGLGNVDNTADTDKPISTATQTALDLKADIASPTFTGIPAAPTADSGDSSTQIATTEFVTNAIADIDTTGTTYDVATDSVDGLMSSTDKAKLDAVEEGAQVNVVTSVDGSTGAVDLSAIYDAYGSAATVQTNLAAHASSSNTAAHTIANINDLAAILKAMSQKNIILNGEFAVDQDENGEIAATSTATYITDGWIQHAQTAGTGVFLGSVNLDDVVIDGYKGQLGFEVSTAQSTLNATDAFYFRQNIEGSRSASLNWHDTTTANRKDAILVFTVKSSIAGTFGGCLRGNSADAYYPFTYTVDTANTPQRCYVAIPAPTIGTWVNTTAANIQLNFGVGIGATYSGTADTWASSGGYLSATGVDNHIGTAGATLYITGVDLYPIDDASNLVVRPYQHKDYEAELDECQRYFEVLNGVGTGGSFGAGNASQSIYAYPLVTHKRKRGTSWTLSGVGTFNLTDRVANYSASDFTIFERSDAGTVIQVTSSGLTAPNSYTLRAAAADTKIAINARL